MDALNDANEDAIADDDDDDGNRNHSDNDTKKNYICDANGIKQQQQQIT